MCGEQLGYPGDEEYHTCNYDNESEHRYEYRTDTIGVDGVWIDDLAGYRSQYIDQGRVLELKQRLDPYEKRYDASAEDEANDRGDYRR